MRECGNLFALGAAAEHQLGRCHIAEPVHRGLGWQILPGTGALQWVLS